MIYVDPLFSWAPKVSGQAGRHFGGGKRSCHMWTDGTVEELNAFAVSIGMKVEWLQVKHKGFPHYDLTPGRRAQAIAKGAVEIELIDYLRERRVTQKEEQDADRTKNGT